MSEIAGSSKCVKFLPFNSPKNPTNLCTNSTYLEDPGDSHNLPVNQPVEQEVHSLKLTYPLHMVVSIFIKNLLFEGAPIFREGRCLCFFPRLCLALKSGPGIAGVVGVNCFLPKVCATFGCYLMLALNRLNYPIWRDQTMHMYGKY